MERRRRVCLERQHLWGRPTAGRDVDDGVAGEVVVGSPADGVVVESLGGGLRDGPDHLTTIEGGVLLGQQRSEPLVARHDRVVRTGRDLAGEADFASPSAPPFPQDLLVDDLGLGRARVERGHLRPVRRPHAVFGHRHFDLDPAAAERPAHLRREPDDLTHPWRRRFEPHAEALSQLVAQD